VGGPGLLKWECQVKEQSLKKELHKRGGKKKGIMKGKQPNSYAFKTHESKKHNTSQVGKPEPLKETIYRRAGSKEEGKPAIKGGGT